MAEDSIQFSRKKLFCSPLSPP